MDLTSSFPNVSSFVTNVLLNPPISSELWSLNFSALEFAFLFCWHSPFSAQILRLSFIPLNITRIVIFRRVFLLHFLVRVLLVRVRVLLVRGWLCSSQPNTIQE